MPWRARREQEADEHHGDADGKGDREGRSAAIANERGAADRDDRDSHGDEEVGAHPFLWRRDPLAGTRGEHGDPDDNDVRDRGVPDGQRADGAVPPPHIRTTRDVLLIEDTFGRGWLSSNNALLVTAPPRDAFTRVTRHNFE